MASPDVTEPPDEGWLEVLADILWLHEHPCPHPLTVPDLDALILEPSSENFIGWKEPVASLVGVAAIA